MKHSGRARKAAYKLILLSLVLVGLILVGGVVATVFGGFVVAVTPFLAILWMVFALFTLYFFRDPQARVPAGGRLVVSPAHGKVDVIDTLTESQFMGGPCQRVSVFLSVIDVHVQNAPISGKIAFYKYSTGQFLNALRTDSAQHNENVLLGLQDMDQPQVRVGVRLIAGVLARRIVPFVQPGDEVARGDRIGLIQFGSRADLYLPAGAIVRVKLGDRVVGGETVLAEFPSVAS